LGPAPCEQGSRKIQLPYLNKFDTIWEYKKSFLSRRIDFFTYLGPTCPLCGDVDCYRQITPYWRYAVDLFQGFRKERIPIARFLCRKEGLTFSLLPIQLVPYFQYTVASIMWTLLLGFGWWQMGQGGFFGASVEVDPDSDMSPYLIFCWLKAILRGFRHAHAVLRKFYDLSNVYTSKRGVAWEELSGYFLALGLKPQSPWRSALSTLLYRYSLATTQFLFGTASQYRTPSCR
jgi:hypothetical protein